MKNPVAICIGHSRKAKGITEGGAVMVGGANEHSYNLPLGARIVKILTAQKIPAILIPDYFGASYGSAQRWLAGHLKLIGAVAAVELHFNSSDNLDANGHEWLHWHTSKRGKDLAMFLEGEMCLMVPEIKARGVKPRTAKDRGSEFLSGTPCPAVIAETFFGSNPHDCSVATLKKERIAEAIAEGIASWLD